MKAKAAAHLHCVAAPVSCRLVHACGAHRLQAEHYFAHSYEFGPYYTIGQTIRSCLDAHEHCLDAAVLLMPAPQLAQSSAAQDWRQMDVSRQGLVGREQEHWVVEQEVQMPPDGRLRVPARLLVHSESSLKVQLQVRGQGFQLPEVHHSRH